MSKPIRFQFDASQPHQLRAIESTVQLFEELRPYDAAAYRQKVKDTRLGFDDVVANFPMHAELSDDWLLANLNNVRVANGLGEVMEVELDDGPMLEDVKMDAHSFPCFTVEMETGTGKTYVYLRTIQELRARYQLRKFIIVVPSVAIYEGVIKSVETTKEHFKGLYSNEVPRVIEYELPVPTEAILAVGPEGGFSENEGALLQRMGFARLRLGPRVLRTETAGLAVIAALQSHWGDL